jgi:hypothetical protein
MGKDSHFEVYFDGNFTIDDAEKALRTTTMTVTRDGDAIDVQWKDGPILSMGLNEESWVELEAQEISEDHEVPALANCKRRFEVLFDDLEEVLDDYNTLFEMQMTLQALTKGWILQSWNGVLLPFEEG